VAVSKGRKRYLTQVGKSDKDIKQTIAELESEGYVVRKRREKYIKKTFEIRESRLAEFTKLREELDVKVAAAIDQALWLWIEQNKKK
jgi:hypothetical protein